MNKIELIRYIEYLYNEEGLNYESVFLLFSKKFNISRFYFDDLFEGIIIDY